MSICPRCQTPNPDGAIVCGRCGYPIQTTGGNTNQNPYFGQPNIAINSESSQNKTNTKLTNGDINLNHKKTETNDSNSKTSIWQIISCFFLFIIIILLTCQTLGIDLSNKSQIPAKSNEAENASLTEDITLDELQLDTSKESDPLFEKLGSYAKQRDILSFDDFDLEMIDDDSVYIPTFYSDVTLALNENKTSYQHKKDMQKLNGNYYRIYGKIEDIFSSGRVSVTAGNSYKDYSINKGVGVSVYGFTEEKLLSFSKGEWIDIVIKVIYSDSIDGKDDTYYMAAVYVQDF